MKKHTVYLINGFGGPNWCFETAVGIYKKAGFNPHVLRTVKLNTAKPHKLCDAVFTEIEKNGMNDYSIVGYSYGGIISMMILQKIIKGRQPLPSNVITISSPIAAPTLLGEFFGYYDSIDLKQLAQFPNYMVHNIVSEEDRLVHSDLARLDNAIVHTCRFKKKSLINHLLGYTPKVHQYIIDNILN
jgi:hypothetical protein